MRTIPSLRFIFVLVALVVAGAEARARDNQVSIHDPVLAKEGDTYYLFSTGPGITVYSSKDLVHWHHRGRVFADEPAWARQVAPEFNGHLWAPDIVEHNGKFHLYYSVSAFGKNTSAIGVTVTDTLDTSSPRYQWRDQGPLLQSVPERDLWNAIDPAVIADPRGGGWMAFGSFWGGLKMVRLDDTLLHLAEPQEWRTLAKRERSLLIDDRLPGPAEIEAPFLYPKNGYYYLFVSWDKCCLGTESTYRMVVGRSRDLRGPYLDREGRDLAQGGGTLLLAGDERFAGLGHNSVYSFEGRDLIVFHAYENADNGLQKLKIVDLHWDAEGWPRIDPAEVRRYVSVLLP